MKKFLLGIFFIVALQFSISLYYTYSFDKAFINECGVKNGYIGANPKRFNCVYKELGYLTIFSKVVLSRPVYMNNKIYFRF